MPDKRYKRGCGRECLRCWRNKLKHGNKLKKKKGEKPVEKAERNDLCIRVDPKYTEVSGKRIVVKGLQVNPYDMNNRDPGKYSYVMKTKTQIYRAEKQKKEQNKRDAKVMKGLLLPKN